MSAFRNDLTRRFFSAALGVAMVAIVLGAGCKSPFPGFSNKCSCATECECGDACCDLPECSGCELPACSNCGSPTCACGMPHYGSAMPHYMCGPMKSLCRVPCEQCGYFLHFCERSDYVGPVEPPRPPRFHPVPTQPVFAQGLP